MRSFLFSIYVTLCVFTNGSTEAVGQPVNLRSAKPGVSVHDGRAFEGLTLIAPMRSTVAYLIDMDGRVVHTWHTGCFPGMNTTLLDNGHLLRTGQPTKADKNAPGQGGRLLEFNWEGELVWDYSLPADRWLGHHDAIRLPNGNYLMLAAEHIAKDKAVLAGRRPELINESLMSDAVLEIRPTGKTTGEIVWEWRIWDHLVQDTDKQKDNYDRIAARRDRIDVNYYQGTFAKLAKKTTNLEILKGLGYLGGSNDVPVVPPLPFEDWSHSNSLAYNADLDQIMITSYGFSEFWIIDHSTTTAEAATSKGGKSGKGGDLLYRWGNPNTYRTGTNADQRLFNPHNAHWIPKGFPGAGNVMVFNNGLNRTDGSYSSVEEIVLPTQINGRYEQRATTPNPPTRARWTFTLPNKAEFFSPFVCGAHRLPNGNTLICSGPQKRVFEVTAEGVVVWLYATEAIDALQKKNRPLPIGFDKALKLDLEQRRLLESVRFLSDPLLDKVVSVEQKAILEKIRIPTKANSDVGSLFRAERFGLDHPAIKGRVLNMRSNQGSP